MKRVLFSVFISFLLLGGLAITLTQAADAQMKTADQPAPAALPPEFSGAAAAGQEDQTTSPPEPSGPSQADARLVELGIALDAARNAGPDAVLAFVHSQELPFDSLQVDLLQAAVLDAQAELVTLQLPAPAEGGQNPAAPVQYVSINTGPCAYSSIQAAINASAAGDTIRIAAGVYSETIDITNKKITLAGGYNNTCSTLTTGRSSVNIAAAGSVVDFNGGSQVTLRSLDISKGSGFGAGVDLLGSSHVILDNSLVHDNKGSNGGGAYIGGGSVLTLTNGSSLYNNTGTAGAGAIVYGRLVGAGAKANIYHNSAANDGGGIYIPAGTVILTDTRVYGNSAGRNGGGIYMSNATLVLFNTAAIGATSLAQTAVDGAGVYAMGSTIRFVGKGIAVLNNSASNNGGGLYLANRTKLDVSGGRIGSTASAAAGNDAVQGGGMFVYSSTVNFSGSIVNNIASISGGGVYATEGDLNFTSTTIGGTTTNTHNQIGPSGLNGAGLYLINRTRATFISSNIISNTLSNTATGYGGGLYVRANSIVTLTNSTIQRHLTPSMFDGRGAAVYLYDAAVYLDNSDVLSNTTNNLGGGVRLYGTSTLKIVNGSTFRANRALGGEGGAVAATGSATILVSHSSFSANQASTDGGAICISTGGNPSQLTVDGIADLQYNAAGRNGGAIAAIGAVTLKIHTSSAAAVSSIAHNAAGSNGGGIFADTTAIFELQNTQIMYPLSLDSNTAGANGGAIFASGTALVDGYGYLVFTSNTAGAAGGAVALQGGRMIWLDDYFTVGSQLTGNLAQRGGAIYASASGRVECDGVLFGSPGSGNQAVNGSGGAIYLAGSIFTADNCNFSNNRATAGDGGAIAAFTSTLTIGIDAAALPDLHAEQAEVLETALPAWQPGASLATVCNSATTRCSHFRDNAALGVGSEGGAIYSNNSSLIMDQIYLYSNSAERGGAILHTGSGARSTLRNLLVFKNNVTTPFGAGIRMAGGAYTITHSTIADNTGGAGLSTGVVISSIVTNSIIWRNSVGAYTSLTLTACNIDQAGLAGPAINPLFVNPGMENYHLRSTSPALDACASGLTTDLEQRTRPQGTQFDMGALEGEYFVVFIPAMRR